MTDTAWISLAVIVVAICVLIAVLATRWMREFRLSFPVPFLKGDFVLSPHDSKGVNQENLLRLEQKLFDTFLELTKRGEEIDRDAMRRTDTETLESLVSFNLLHSEGRSVDPDTIELGYLGWQALQNWLRQNKRRDNPKIKPWSWPQNFPHR
jgi:hypothetical protein